MKIILKQNFDNLGKFGDVVEVKDGYARNFLIPRQIAIHANDRNMRLLEQERKRVEVKQSKEKRSAEDLAKSLEPVSLTATVAVGEEDKVFGAVTSQDIAELLKAKGFDIDRRKIVLDEPLKALGVYEVAIKLHADVEAKVKVWVVKE
ncbi:MAG TPA: 50S ribosomal protein L9 [bacterium]